MPVTQPSVTAIHAVEGRESFSRPLSFCPAVCSLLAVAQFADESLRGDFEDQVMWTVVHGGKAPHEERKILMELDHSIGLD